MRKTATFLYTALFLLFLFMALASAESLSPWQVWEAHTYALATQMGKSPYTTTDPGNGDKPLAVVEVGGQTYKLWWNKAYQPPAAKPQAAQPVQTATQPVASPAPQTVNAEKLREEFADLVKFYMGTPSKLTITHETAPDPLAIAHTIAQTNLMRKEAEELEARAWERVNPPTPWPEPRTWADVQRGADENVWSFGLRGNNAANQTSETLKRLYEHNSRRMR